MEVNTLDVNHSISPLWINTHAFALVIYTRENINKCLYGIMLVRLLSSIFLSKCCTVLRNIFQNEIRSIVPHFADLLINFILYTQNQTFNWIRWVGRADSDNFNIIRRWYKTDIKMIRIRRKWLRAAVYLYRFDARLFVCAIRRNEVVGIKICDQHGSFARMSFS